MGISEENEMSIEWVSALHVNCIQDNFLKHSSGGLSPLLGNSLKTSVDYNPQHFIFVCGYLGWCSSADLGFACLGQAGLELLARFRSLSSVCALEPRLRAVAPWAYGYMFFSHRVAGVSDGD